MRTLMLEYIISCVNTWACAKETRRYDMYAYTQAVVDAADLFTPWDGLC